jgi:glucokinase
VANLIAFTDGIVVLGGGLSAAAELFMPAVMDEVNSYYKISEGKQLKRIIQTVFNFDLESDKHLFVKDYTKNIALPNSNKTVKYDSKPRVAIAKSKLGAENAIAIGAYYFALKQLDS